MRVAIVGGTGLVGRHLAALLAERGDETVVVARHPGAGPGRFHRADIESAAELEAALADCQAVVSCFGSLRQSRDRTFRDVHVRGLRHLLLACGARSIRRLVHLSALSAAGSSPSAFLRAKYAGEELLARALLDVTVLRPSLIFGPGDDFVLPLAALLRRLPLAPLPGNGQTLLQPIAAADVALAIARALEREDTIGARLDLPGPDVLTLAEVYDRVMAAARLARPKVRVPYALIEPITHLVRQVPGIGFTFDQLAVLESERPADPAPAASRLGLPLSRFTVPALRDALFPAAALAGPGPANPAQPANPPGARG